MISMQSMCEKEPLLDRIEITSKVRDILKPPSEEFSLHASRHWHRYEEMPLQLLLNSN